MDKQLRYREKHVHDLPVEDSFVRLWDAEGAVNQAAIQSAFRPLLKTGYAATRSGSASSVRRFWPTGCSEK